MPPPSAKWLTAKQAADYIQRSTRTLKRWRQNDGGPTYSRGEDGRVRYAIVDLEDFMRARAGSSRADFEPYKPAVVGRR